MTQDHFDEPPPGPRHGSAAEGVGDEVTGVAVDVPWDTYLGEGAMAAIRDGSLGVVRHSYPAAAAADMRRAATATGQLLGDAATQERLAAVGLGVAAIRHRPVRLPHRPSEEPHAWWIAEERTLVWMPWGDIDMAPPGMALLDSGEADAVTVLAPDAAWTVFTSGIPRDGARGNYEDLPERIKTALGERVKGDLSSALWRRDGDTVSIRWREAGKVKSASIEVNRLRFQASRGTPT